MKGRVSIAVIVLLAICLGQGKGIALEGYATWYSRESCQREGNSGIYTASGERFREDALTCALPSHSFGGFYKVCLKEDSNRCVTVRHNDYGSGKKPRSKGVLIDLSKCAFEMLAPVNRGKIKVIIIPLNRTY